MEHDIFTQLTVILVLVTAVSFITRLLKQPLIMGYIVTGILVGPSLLNLVHNQEAFSSFSQIGITLLLFIIGLGLNPAVIKNLGKPVILTAAAILLLVGSTGWLASHLLGFSNTESLIMGIALFFSSTIIILKVISDKHELSRLYAQISIGVIVLDDVIATLALLVVAAAGTAGGLQASDFAILAAKGIGLAIILYLVGSKIMPKLASFFAGSQELLFLFTVAWGFGVASLFHAVGYSHEVGALFAGVSLASLPYATQMGARLKPLRDFFIVLFFVSLGSTLALSQFATSLVPALILSAVVMFGKPIFVFSSLITQGYTGLTSFKAAIHLSQISEFSIILLVFAASVGLVSHDAMAVITVVAVITIGISTYLMKYDDILYHHLKGLLATFQRANVTEKKRRASSYDTIIFGFHKGGHEFLQTFREMNEKYLVVDYDPDVIEHLETQGIRHAYGDATDSEFLDEIGADKARLIVCTITDFHVNKDLLYYLTEQNPAAAFICHANNYDEAANLYTLGASYVMLPHFIGSEKISAYIKKHGIEKAAFEAYRQKHAEFVTEKALLNPEFGIS